jgi:hypothetical protein
MLFGECAQMAMISAFGRRTGSAPESDQKILDLPAGHH